MFLRYHHLSRVLIRVVINLGVITLANGPRLLTPLEVMAAEAESYSTAPAPQHSRDLEGDHQWVNRDSNKSQAFSRGSAMRNAHIYLLRYK